MANVTTLSSRSLGSVHLPKAHALRMQQHRAGTWRSNACQTGKVHTHACGWLQQQQPRAVATGHLAPAKGTVLPSKMHVAAASAPVADCTPTVGLKVVGLCGSLREGSLTRKALEAALQGAKSAQCDVELLDLSSYRLYLCDGLDPESNNAKIVLPNDVAKLREKLRGAQGILLGTPEYHGSFSGVLKNAIDLCGFEEFEGKVVGLCAVSGGAMGGVSALNGLRDVSRALHAWVIPSQVTVPQAWKNLGDDGIQKRLYNLGRDVGKYSQLLANKEAQAFLESFEKGGWENPGGASDGSAMPTAAQT